MGVKLRIKKKVINEQAANMLLEMAKLNLKEDSKSLFPANAYRIWGQGDNSPHKEPHLHIRSKQEGWELKVYIKTCELWEVVNSGKRKSKDFSIYQDVIKNLKEWFKLPTTMTGRIGTNQETAYNEWVACNED